MNAIIPTTISYRGPEKTEIRIDEDGPRLVIDGRSVMEWVDLQRLVEIIHAAGAAWEAKQSPMPAPPSREDAREMYFEDRERYALGRARRALEREFRTGEEGPF